MTKREAFTELTSKRAWYNDLNIPMKAANSAKRAFNDGTLSSDKIDEILKKAGYQIVQQEIWSNAR